ncbi:MAG: pitrilysin family protein [bacterium]
MEKIGTDKFLDTYPVNHFRWENGFEALLVDNPISPVAAYLTLYGVGSAAEGDRERGLAHFFEHMMFRETATLADGDFDRIMSQIGGVGLNASTAYDATTYHVNVPAAHLGRVVELEADRMVNLRLSPELIQRERGAVLGEIKMYRDMPSEQHWDALMAAAFPSHPYRHPIIGYVEQVEAFSDQDFAAFYRKHYAPNRAVVVIAGGFDERSVLEMLDRAYGDLPRGAAPGAAQGDSAPAAAAPAPQEAAANGHRRVELTHDKISTESLTLAYPTPGLTHRDLPALILLSALLAAGQSSPLYRRIVLKGLATHVSASQLETEMMLTSPGLFLIDVSLKHGVAAEVAEEAIAEVFGTLLRDGVQEQDLERARNQIKLSFYSGMRTNMNLARQIGGYRMACGDALFSQRLLQALAGVDPAELIRTLTGYLIDRPGVVAVQRPAAGAGAA